MKFAAEGYGDRKEHSESMSNIRPRSATNKSFTNCRVKS